MVGGGYDAGVAFRGDDPVNPIITVPTHLDVIGAPDIATDPETLDFGELFVGDTAQRTLVVHNIGSEVLNVSGAVTDDPDFSVSALPFTLGPGGQVELTVLFTPDAPGPVAATLTLSSDDPDDDW